MSQPLKLSAMRRPLFFAPLAAALVSLTLGGCAKSPAGGPTIRTANRFETTLSLVGTLNPNYYYGVAFDDTGAGVGPAALLGNTPIQNGVVGGTFRLLILYHLGNFQVFYRSTPSDAATEREISGSNGLFVFTPRATTNGLDFTVDLDAQLPGSTTYIFPRNAAGTAIGTDRFDLNAVTTNTINRDPADNRVKPVDALGPAQVATPVQIQIGATRTTSVSDATGATNDENFGVDPSFSNPASNSYVPFDSIDISGLQIGITRSN